MSINYSYLCRGEGVADWLGSIRHTRIGSHQRIIIKLSISLYEKSTFYSPGGLALFAFSLFYLQSTFSISRMILQLHDFGHGHGHSHSSKDESHSHSSISSKQEGHSHVKQTNMNIRAAIIHVIGDLVQSIGVFIAALVIYFKPEWSIIDPICTFLFSILVLLTTIKIMNDALLVIIEILCT